MSYILPKKVVDYVKKDYLFIVACLIFILVLMYIQLKQAEYENLCNDHWIKQIEENCNENVDFCQWFSVSGIDKITNTTSFVPFNESIRWY